MIGQLGICSYGTPFLLDLGLTEQLTSLVWLAGPISGLIAQPVIGEYLSPRKLSEHPSAFSAHSPSTQARSRTLLHLGTGGVSGLCPPQSRSSFPPSPSRTAERLRPSLWISLVVALAAGTRRTGRQ